MNKLLTKIVGVVLGTTMAVGVGVGVAVNNSRDVVDSQVEATDSTYIFNSKSWGATLGGTTANWTSGKEGNSLASGQGVQITTGTTGANATSPVSFTNVSEIVVTYCTNASKGAGTIKVKVGSGTEKSFSVSAPSSGGTTLKTTTFSFNPNETGKVKITGNCTTNSIYIYSVKITTNETPAVSYTLSFDANGGTGTVPANITGSGTKTLPSSASLTNTGYILDGWGDNEHKNDQTAQYALGASYTLSSTTTLFAHWTPAYTVTYTAGENGTGSYSHSNQPKGDYNLIEFSDATGISANSGYQFKCWNVGGVDKNPGDTITLSSATTVTALFEEIPSYSRITEVSKISEDYRYMIVYETGKKVMGTQNNSSYRNIVSCTISNNKVEADDSYAQIAIESAGDGYWYLKDTTATAGYLYTDTDSSNYLKTNANKGTGDTANQYKWSIEFVGNNVVIKSVAYAGSNRYIMFNDRFATYKGTQQDIQLYRENKIVPSITVDQTDVVVGTKSSETVNASYVDGATGTINWTVKSGSDKISLANETGTSNTITGVAVGTATIEVSCGSYRKVTINVHVIAGSAYVASKITKFDKVTSNLSDWTGLYILASKATGTSGSYYVNGHYYSLNGSTKPLNTGSLNYTEVNVSNNSITATSDVINLAFLITKSDVDGLYYVKSYFGGYYIGNETTNNTIVASRVDKMYISLSTTGITSYVNSSESSGTKLGMQTNAEKTKMCFNSVSGSYVAELYKADGDIFEIAQGGSLDTFYNNVKSQEALVCGDTSKLDWTKLENLYSPLSSSDKNVLKTAIAKASESGGNYFEDFLSDYDYCVSVLKKDDIFERYSSGGANYQGSRNISNANSSKGTMIVVISVIAFVSLASLSGYFLLRKRKEER